MKTLSMCMQEIRCLITKIEIPTLFIGHGVAISAPAVFESSCQKLSREGCSSLSQDAAVWMSHGVLFIYHKSCRVARAAVGRTVHNRIGVSSRIEDASFCIVRSYVALDGQLCLG